MVLEHGVLKFTPVVLYFILAKAASFWNCYQKVLLTVWVFCQNGIGRQERLRLAFFIDGRDLKLIQMAGLETLGCCVAGGAL